MRYKRKGKVVVVQGGAIRIENLSTDKKCGVKGGRGIRECDHDSSGNAIRVE